MTDSSTPPATPAEASARLNAVTANPEWTAKMLAGNGPEVRELHELVAKKAEGSKLDQIMNGSLPTGPMQMNEAGVSPANAVASVAWLREASVSDGAVRQLFEGQPVSREEFQAAERLRASRLGDKAWITKLLTGDHDAKAELALMSIIRVNGQKEAAR
jgi:hypothetical protein